MVGAKQLEDVNLLAECANAITKQLKLHQFLEGASVPLYCFGSQCLIDHESSGELLCVCEDEVSILDTLLLAQWEDRTIKGILRYDVTATEIKASPMEYGHVLLVPYGTNSFYQFLGASCLEMAVRVAVGINNCCFCLFYDYPRDASHLYFQACYFSNPLAVELVPFDVFYGDVQSGIRISVITDHPIKTLLFESSQKFKIMMEVLAKICTCLVGMKISHNLLISDCGKKIFLFLQQQKLENTCFLSALECGGYFMFKLRSEFDLATENNMLKKLSTVSIDDEDFKAVKLLCCSIARKFSFEFGTSNQKLHDECAANSIV